MEPQKRHNPEITPEDKKAWGVPAEDSAVKAFDSLDQVVDSSITKTERVSLQELHQLVTGVFGNDLYFGYDPKNIDNFNETSFTGNCKVELYKKTKQKWYQRKKTNKYLTLEVESVQVKANDDAQKEVIAGTFFEKGKYASLKLTAHTTEALKQAKIFAAAYQNLTKQKASIIQDCIDNVTTVKKTSSIEEKIVEEKPKTKNALSESLSAVPPILACSAIAYFLGVSNCAGSIVTNNLPAGLNFGHHLSAGSGLYGGYTKSTPKKIMTLLTLGVSLTPELFALYNGGSINDAGTSVGFKAAGYGLGYLISYFFTR